MVIPDLPLLAPHVAVIICLAACCGALVQGSVGFGLGPVAAPIIALADPRLMPEGLLVAATLLPILTLWDEWKHVDRSGLCWALAGRLPGTLCGVWILAALSLAALQVLVALAVLAAVALSLTSVRIRKTRATIAIAGMASGVTGTSAAIGGPPLALVYQHEVASSIRATLGAYFIVGSAMSLLFLLLAGEIDKSGMFAGLLMIPSVALGFAISRPLRRRLDAGRMRYAILTVTAGTAAALLIKSVA